MGNSPTSQSTNQTYGKNRQQSQSFITPGCIGCFVNPEMKDHNGVDTLELQTHNQEQVPKGKISIRSISYLTNDEIGFLKACAGKNISAIRYYLKKNVNVNLLDEDRTSPLHVACRSGSLQVVEELLNWGSMIDIADIAGWTPLHIAAFYQRPYICHILLKKGAYPYYSSRNGETPWDLVKDKNTEEIFFVHFDRAELRKMSRVKTANPPGEVVDENVGITGPIPRENAFRSMVELEYKDFVREGKILASPKFKENAKQFSNIQNRHSKNQQAGPLSNKEENFNTKTEEVGNAQTVPVPKEKKNLKGITFPKKHKYYLYFKNLKQSQVKNSRDQQDFLCTLRSEDSYTEDNQLVGLSSFEQQQASQHEITSQRKEDEDPSENIQPIELGFSKENSKSISLAGNQPTPKSGFRTNRGNLSRNQSLNNSFTAAQLNNSRVIDKNNTSVKSLILFQPTISLLGLIQKDYSTDLLKSFADSENDMSMRISQIQNELKLSPEDSDLFKVDSNNIDQIYKMGIELFNFDGIKGLAFLMLFKLLRKNIKEVAFFLYKEETNMTFKKSPKQITNILTNNKVKECKDLIQNYAGFYHFEGLQFFDALKNYLLDFKLDNDPEKIDWVLRGFAVKYYAKAKKASQVQMLQAKENFESVEAVRMLAFACVMLSIEIHGGTQNIQSKNFEDNYYHEQKLDFEANLLGVNEGENFNKAFIKDLFDKIKQQQLIKVYDQDANLDLPKKLSFRSAKFVIKAFRNSKKQTTSIKDYLLYFNGPIIFIVRLFQTSSAPRVVLQVQGSKLKKFQNSMIQIIPQSGKERKGLSIAQFKNNSIILGNKSEFTFILQNPGDYQKIETYFKSYN